MQVQDTPQHVVVWDPEGKFWEGALVDYQLAKSLHPSGVVTLPCVPDLFRLSGVGGYAKRSWGAGIPLDSMAPQLVAPLTIFCQPEVRGMTWAARLVPDVRADGRSPKGKLDGMVRFASDSAQRTPSRGAFVEIGERPVMVRDFGEADEHGGWTIGGKGHLSLQGEGHYGFALYATAPGFRVVWLAAAVAPLRM